VSNSAQADGNKQRWIEQIGVYYYYSLILSAFDPVRADAIFDLPAHRIAEAYVSKMAYEFIKPQK